jgi:hypothetical protein
MIPVYKAHMTYFAIPIRKTAALLLRNVTHVVSILIEVIIVQ